MRRFLRMKFTTLGQQFFVLKATGLNGKLGADLMWVNSPHFIINLIQSVRATCFISWAQLPPGFIQDQLQWIQNFLFSKRRFRYKKLGWKIHPGRIYQFWRSVTSALAKKSTTMRNGE